MMIAASAFTESVYRDSQLCYFTCSKHGRGDNIHIIPSAENEGRGMTNIAKEVGKVVLNFYSVPSHVNQAQ